MKKELRKKAILRGFFGIPTGISIGYLITIVLSLIWGQGYYSPCVPELAKHLGNEILAVLLQTALCALLGITFGAASVLWEIEHWGIAKQTGIYFLVISTVMLPTAYALYWMEHSLKGFLCYLGIFVLIFLVIWISQYMMAWQSIRKINQKLK